MLSSPRPEQVVVGVLYINQAYNAPEVVVSGFFSSSTCTIKGPTFRVYDCLDGTFSRAFLRPASAAACCKFAGPLSTARELRKLHSRLCHL